LTALRRAVVCSRGARSSAVLAVLAAVALIGTAGCSAVNVAKQARRAHTARVDLTGLSRSQLEGCAGNPSRIQTGDGFEYLTYVGPEQIDDGYAVQCVATFMLRNGYVENLDYENSNGGLMGNHISACLPIVQACLPPVEE
jgi:hypothetical protein